MKNKAKRVFDFAFALVLILLLSPFLLIFWILVQLKLGRPVLFKQERPGLHGKVFMLYKFRSMTDAKDDNGQLRPDSERLTAFGRFLRKSSIDELPELFNIIKGDMSFVGPRPLLVQYLPRYNKEQSRRHEVKPGLTGWAQINGRNTISWEEKFKMDVWYVENWSLWLDLKILFLTLTVVLKRTGISADGEATMSEFMGSTGEDK